MQQPTWNFEQDPTDERMDETGYNLRAYFDRMADDKLRQYSRAWSDQQLMEWDGNFKSDGDLLLPCSERDVDVAEYRRVIEQCIRYRDRVRSRLVNTAQNAARWRRHRLLHRRRRALPELSAPGARMRLQARHARQKPSSDGAVRVSRETQGRKGKGVTVISGLGLPPNELDALATELKKHCGSGGSVDNGRIEIQGDHRDRLVEELTRRGWHGQARRRLVLRSDSQGAPQ